MHLWKWKNDRRFLHLRNEIQETNTETNTQSSCAATMVAGWLAGRARVTFRKSGCETEKTKAPRS